MEGCLGPLGLAHKKSMKLLLSLLTIMRGMGGSGGRGVCVAFHTE